MTRPDSRPKTWQEAKEEVFCRVYGHYWDLNRECMTCGKRRPDSNPCTRRTG